MNIKDALKGIVDIEPLRWTPEEEATIAALMAEHKLTRIAAIQKMQRMKKGLAR